MKDEPVLNDAAKQLLVTIITWLAARFVPGLNLSPAQATAIALGVLGALTVVWGFITRKKVVAMTKVEERLANEHPAALAAIKRAA